MKWLRMMMIACVAAMTVPAYAQWPKHLNPGVPLKDGKPDLDAPPPKAPDGHVDLSGVWETFTPRPPGAPQRGGGRQSGGQRGAGPQRAGTPPSAPARGAGTPAAPGQVAARGTGQLPPGGGNPFGNIGIQQPGREAPYQPWAADLVKKRMADNSKDNPDAHCLPMGVMQMTSHPYPKKIIQTPTEVLMIYEASGTTVREIFLDRPLPKAEDVEPFWNGYSVGHWEGDTLVVETTGFMDDGWLDVRGSPLTNEGTLTERYRRPSMGRLEIEVTVDDPKAYTKPFTATVQNRLLPDTQLIEFVCLDKDAQHYVGSDASK